jgi:hypothetical protein
VTVYGTNPNEGARSFSGATEKELFLISFALRNGMRERVRLVRYILPILYFFLDISLDALQQARMLLSFRSRVSSASYSYFPFPAPSHRSFVLLRFVPLPGSRGMGVL